MGKKSGPPAPPPPPDYTSQRESAVSKENESRNRLAGDYNDRIKLFNSSLTDSASGIGGFRDTVGGLSLGDDLSGLSDIESEIESLRGNLESFNAGDVSWMGGVQDSIKAQEAEKLDALANIDPSAFDFTNLNLNNIDFGGFAGANFGLAGQGSGRSGFGSYEPPQQLQYDQFGLPVSPGFNPAGESYGASVMYDMPTLSELNTGLSNKYLGDLNRIQESIDDLQAREEAEKRRGKDFFTQYVNEANQGDIDIEFADLILTSVGSLET